MRVYRVPKESGIQCDTVVPEPPYYVTRSNMPRYRARAERRGFEITKCQHTATYKVDGHLLCAKHAGSIVLRRLLRETESAELSP